MMDRFFDNYVMTPTQRIVADFIRVQGDRDPIGVEEARTLLDTSYRWLNGVMATRLWACGDDFSLADCAAAPALFYSDWITRSATSFPRSELTDSGSWRVLR